MARRVAFAAALASASFAWALNAAAATDNSQRQQLSDAAAQCAALETEWKAAEATCSTNANLGRARALAHEGELKCKSPEASQRKLGVGKYESALRLCRKPEGSH